MNSSVPREWNSVAKTLHWVMAALIFIMFILGWTAVTYPLSPTKLDLFIWHKSIGLSLLALVVVRLLWRMFNPAPEPPANTTTLENLLARLGHMTLYGLMILMPLTGYIINSTANFSFRFFGWVRVPNIIPPNKTWQEGAELIHLGLFWIFVSVIAVHMAAAFRHHVVKKDDVLIRMLPRSHR